MLSPLCFSSFTVSRSDELAEKYGIKGVKFRGDGSEFDNGTLYPEVKCFSPEDNVMPSGVRFVPFLTS